MTLMCYKPKKFNDEHQAIIDHANDIIEEYEDEGYDLTLRQLYYQFVAKGLIDNKQKVYKWLGGIIGDARLAGKVSWDAIVDRTRGLKELGHWDSPAEILRTAANGFHIDKWDVDYQDTRVEVWVEKEALAGVVGRICNRLDVPFFCCRGYVSLSEMHAAARRLIKHQNNGQDVRIIHLGDHDPSGMDMTDDIRKRMEMFGVYQDGGEIVDRIALNMDQIREFNPPPNDAKLTDSRSKRYVHKYGYESWELDALDPKTLDKLITEAVKSYRDEEAWDAAVSIENNYIADLHEVAEKYEG